MFGKTEICESSCSMVNFIKANYELKISEENLGSRLRYARIAEIHTRSQTWNGKKIR
jgi:hypothetical protein